MIINLSCAVPVRPRFRLESARRSSYKPSPDGQNFCCEGFTGYRERREYADIVATAPRNGVLVPPEERGISAANVTNPPFHVSKEVFGGLSNNLIQKRNSI